VSKILQRGLASENNAATLRKYALVAVGVTTVWQKWRCSGTTSMHFNLDSVLSSVSPLVEDVGFSPAANKSIPC